MIRRHCCRLLSTLFFALGFQLAPAMSQTPNPTPDDHHQWLEEVLGDRALDWVRQRNAQTESVLQADPGFAAFAVRATP